MCLAACVTLRENTEVEIVEDVGMCWWGLDMESIFEAVSDIRLGKKQRDVFSNGASERIMDIINDWRVK